LDPGVKLEAVKSVVHQSWKWNRIVLEHFASPLTKRIGGRMSNYLANMLGFFSPCPLNQADNAFLRTHYLPQRERLEQLTGRNLSCWRYGGGDQC
jgi:hypothetical protein